MLTATGVVQSRRDNDLASRFPEIVMAARRRRDLVLDGELVALREGKLDFGALTSFPASRAAAGVTIYYVFSSQVVCRSRLVGFRPRVRSNEPATVPTPVDRQTVDRTCVAVE